MSHRVLLMIMASGKCVYQISSVLVATLGLSLFSNVPSLAQIKYRRLYVACFFIY